MSRNDQRKAWKGGVRPELTTEAREWVAHVESCADCGDGKWIFGACKPGLALYDKAHKPFTGSPV